MALDLRATATQIGARRAIPEDPLLMLRAAVCRQARLCIDEATLERSPDAELIENVPPRVCSMRSDAVDQAIRRCSHSWVKGLHHGLLPLLDVILEQPAGERFVMLALSRTDERVRAGKTISPGFLFATLLWNDVLAKWDARLAKNEHRIPALNLAIDETIDAQTEKLAIQRRFVSDMREIWGLQPRFERRTGRSPPGWREPAVRAGYDFRLSAAADGSVELATGGPASCRRVRTSASN